VGHTGLRVGRVERTAQIGKLPNLGGALGAAIIVRAGQRFHRLAGQAGLSLDGIGSGMRGRVAR